MSPNNLEDSGESGKAAGQQELPAQGPAVEVYVPPAEMASGPHYCELGVPEGEGNEKSVAAKATTCKHIAELSA